MTTPKSFKNAKRARTKSGEQVTDIYFDSSFKKYPIIGKIDGFELCWDLSGRRYSDSTTRDDLVEILEELPAAEITKDQQIAVFREALEKIAGEWITSFRARELAREALSHSPSEATTTEKCKACTGSGQSDDYEVGSGVVYPCNDCKGTGKSPAESPKIVCKDLSGYKSRQFDAIMDDAERCGMNIETYKKVYMEWMEILGVRDRLDLITKRYDELHRWKESALAVEASWDVQAVGREMGLTLGTDIRREILPYIQKLKAQLTPTPSPVEPQICTAQRKKWEPWMVCMGKVWVLNDPEPWNVSWPEPNQAGNMMCTRPPTSARVCHISELYAEPPLPSPAKDISQKQDGKDCPCKTGTPCARTCPCGCNIMSGVCVICHNTGKSPISPAIQPAQRTEHEK